MAFDYKRFEVTLLKTPTGIDLTCFFDYEQMNI